MANHVEFRKVKYLHWGTPGSTPTEQEVLEYRAKDIIISLLGVSLGTWSNWTPIQDVTIIVDVDSNV